jgi:hypothetical protein
MAKVTYFDVDGSAPRVTWRGHVFLHGQPVEIDDGYILGKARGNPFFEVEGENSGDAPAKRKGGWPAGKPRKPREEPAQTQAEEPDDDGGDDE